MRRQGGEGGFFLVTVYGILALALVHCSAMMAHALADVRASQRAQASLQAMFQAEAGVDQAIVQFRNNAGWNGGQGTAGGQGNYTIAVQVLGANRQRVTAQGNTTLAAGGTTSRIVESIIQVTPSVGLPPGLYGDVEVNLNGSVRVDSYDSRMAGFRATNRGMIGTNSIAVDAVRINGSVDVFGDVLSGPGAPPSAIRITGSARVTGRVGPGNRLYPMAPVGEPAGGQDLRINGNQTVTLPGGVHRYRSVTINGGGRLVFEGPATLVVEDFDLNGNGLVTALNKPTNLKIKVVGNAQISLNGASDFYGSIYAPESEIQLNGNNEMFGQVVGRTLVGNGSVAMWYDEALQDGGGGGQGNQVQVLSWTEPGA